MFRLFSLLLLLSSSMIVNSEPLYLMVLGGYNVANYGEPYDIHNSTNRTERIMSEANASTVKYLYAPDCNSANYYWTNSTDNLPGVPGNGTSYWNYLAHMIRNHTQEDVYLMVHSLPTGNINDWEKDNWIECVHKFVFGNNTTAKVTVLWIEGENDSDSAFWWRKEYISQWKSIFTRSQELGNYSWGLGISTYSPYNYYFNERNIRDDLAYLLGSSSNLTIFGGVNSDTLCQDYRYEYKYFNHVGQKQLAYAWNRSIFNRTKEFVNANPSTDNYCNMRIFSLLTALIILAETLLPILVISFCCLFCCIGSYHHWRRQGGNHYYKSRHHVAFSNDLPPKYTEKEPLLRP